MSDYGKLIDALRDGCDWTDVSDCIGYELLMHDAAAAIEHLMRVHWQDEALIEASEETIKEQQAELTRISQELPKRGQYVHGRELSREYIGDCLVSIDYEDWRCSVCGIVFEQWNIPKFNYCPNCGAKMEVQDANS